MPGIVQASQIDSVTGAETAQKSTSGAAWSYQSGGIWDYGAWPSSYFLPVSASLAASASGTVIYTSSDISNYNGFMLEVAAIGGTTPVINAFPSFNGGVNFAATALAWINLQTGAIISGATGLSAIGIYALLNPVGGGLKMNGLKLTQTGGAADQTCTVRGAHVWA